MKSIQAVATLILIAVIDSSSEKHSSWIFNILLDLTQTVNGEYIPDAVSVFTLTKKTTASLPSSKR